jgi:uncharacterized protein YaaQ
MKMLLAILQDTVADPVTRALLEHGFRVTRIASTGGFMRRGNTTLMVGLEDEQVQDALETIRKACPASTGNEKNANIFILNVAHFEQV